MQIILLIHRCVSRCIEKIQNYFEPTNSEKDKNVDDGSLYTTYYHDIRANTETVLINLRNKKK